MSQSSDDTTRMLSSLLAPALEKMSKEVLAKTLSEGLLAQIATKDQLGKLGESLDGRMAGVEQRVGEVEAKVADLASAVHGSGSVDRPSRLLMVISESRPLQIGLGVLLLGIGGVLSRLANVPIEAVLSGF